MAAVTAVVAAAMIALQPTHATASAPLEVTLKSRAEVHSGVVFLRDVVSRCSDDGLTSRRLFQSPGWGESRVVSREEIRRRLAQVSRRTVYLTGAETVMLYRPGKDRSDEVEAALREAIETKARDVTGLTWSLMFPPGPLMLPWGDMEIDCTWPDVLSGNRVVRCRIRVKGKPVKTLSVACRFMRTIAAPVATRRLTRGDTLRATDVAWEQRTFENSVPDLIRPGDTSGGLRVKRVIRVGDVVSRSAVEPHPAVRAGQIIDLVMARRSVRITTRAKALQTGWIGSRIRLQKLTDKKYVYGRVSKEGVAIHE